VSQVPSVKRRSVLLVSVHGEPSKSYVTDRSSLDSASSRYWRFAEIRSIVGDLEDRLVETLALDD
jgi:hypothetical protein